MKKYEKILTQGEKKYMNQKITLTAVNIKYVTLNSSTVNIRPMLPVTSHHKIRFALDLS